MAPSAAFMCIFLVLVALSLSSAADMDPYKVLGVGRRASQQEIKRSYKKLAREWHPDKNKAEGAEKKFVEINQAYEILSNAQRKERYDRYGDTSDSPSKDAGGFQGDFPFGNFGPFQFRYTSSSNFFSKHRITLRMYEQNLVEQSAKKPYILFAYSDWCMPCLQAEPVWEKIVNDLDPVGYGIGTVNNMLDGTLMHKLRVRSLPAIILLINGRTVHYRGQLSVKEVLKFAKDGVSSSLVKDITDKNIKLFLESWRTTNKVSVLMFGSKETPRLRYMLAAMQFQGNCQFGYVHLGRNDKEIRGALDVRISAGETLLIFNDRPELGPVASLSMKTISTDSMLNLIENNKYLLLPRLASQFIFDDLCPPSANSGQRSHLSRKLCAILVVEKGGYDVPHVEAFRNFVEFHAEQKFSKDKIRFLYMYSDVQNEFVKALKPLNYEPDDQYRDIVVVWRTAENQAKFEWLRKLWNGHQDRYNQSAEMMITKMNGYLQGKSVLSRDAALAELVDEYGPGWLSRMGRRTMKLWEEFVFHVSKEELFPALSVIGTLGVIMLIGYGLNYAVALEEKAEHERKARRAARSAATGQQQPQQQKPRSKSDQAVSLLRELRAETSFGMLRLLKPGQRTLVVLVDKESKEELMRDFAGCVWPWRHNKTLMFGFVMVDKNLSWFRQLIEHTIPAEEGTEEQAAAQRMLKRINPKQVVGTVLSLNGWRLYFCMYHPKHAPSMIGFRPKRESKKGSFINYVIQNGETGMSGKFLGFGEEEDESDSDSELKRRNEILRKKELKREELLEGLPNWLDRLFEGSVRRYYVPEWPEMK